MGEPSALNFGRRAPRLHGSTQTTLPSRASAGGERRRRVGRLSSPRSRAPTRHRGRRSHLEQPRPSSWVTPRTSTVSWATVHVVARASRTGLPAAHVEPPPVALTVRKRARSPAHDGERPPREARQRASQSDAKRQRATDARRPLDTHAAAREVVNNGRPAEYTPLVESSEEGPRSNVRPSSPGGHHATGTLGSGCAARAAGQ